MKQNERLLVYAVTGFLALILVIAVLFGNDSKAGEKQQDKGLQNLSDLLQPAGGDTSKSKTGEQPGVGADELGIAPPNAIVGEQPLVARPQLAAEVVARELGWSRRDHNVRFVRVERGDTLESLVREWCGTLDSYLDETRCLNEELRADRLKIGQEVGLPWVDDEVLMGLIQQRAPRTLVSQPAGTPPLNGQPVSYENVSPSRSGGSGRIGLPEFALPGARTTENTGAGGAAGGDANAAAPTIAGTTTYKVVAGDSLWKIAAKKYGKGKADKMVREILAVNPGLSENLQVGQTFQLPAAR